VLLYKLAMLRSNLRAHPMKTSPFSSFNRKLRLWSTSISGLALLTLSVTTLVLMFEIKTANRANEIVWSAQHIASYHWRLHRDPDTSVWSLQPTGDQQAVLLPPWCVARIDEKGFLKEGRLFMFRYVGALNKTTGQVAKATPFHLLDPLWE
jgi:hypothetical protein